MKRLISLSLCIIMLLALLSGVAFANEKPSSWAEEQVNSAIAANFVPSSLQGYYTQATTRAEFCALNVALYESIKGEITGRATFNDTSDVNVEKLASIGVVNGVGNGAFAPKNNLTREQAATLVSRLADAIGSPLPKQETTFSDRNSILPYALEAVGQMQAAGIMGGIGNNTFAPQNPYTREQSIVMVMRMHDYLVPAETPGITSDIFTALEGITFVFSSGAGAWSTEIEIKSDGSFIGYYHDSDMGVTGTNYPNGTRYECHFKGKFKAVSKLDDFTYSLKLDEFTIESKINEEKIVDGIKIIYTDAYGFDDADEFLLYSPGAPIANLPEEFLSWAHINTNIRKTLPSGYYGIYNVNGKEGFVGMSENNVWDSDYMYYFENRKSALWPSYSTPSHLVFWPESGAASIDLCFDWANDEQTEFYAYDYRGSGDYKLTILISDDLTTATITLISLDSVDLSAWGGTTDGKFVAEYVRE